ncbi:MAG: NAD(P)/FAD-dependent oxidoreductase [Candidatus Baltobacteraceae bacterium]
MRYDVAVVGAGPAGSACALRLARAGRNVVIFERTAFPRPKVCGEYLSEAACLELQSLGLAYAVRKEASVLKGIRLHARGSTVELPFARTAWSLARADLDALLCEQARAAGAAVISARVERLQRSASRIALAFRTPSGSEDTLSVDTVVGADGMGSIVAREFGLTAKPRGAPRFALGGHYAGFGGLDQRIEMYVRGRSYFAINPLGEELANVMVIVEQKTLQQWRGAIDERLQETSTELAGGRRTVNRVQLVGKRLAIGPLEHRTRTAGLPGVYLIGDAAGFLDPFTGQGVFLALRSAALAAESIVQGGRFSHTDYALAQRKLFASRARTANLVSALIKTPWLTMLATHSLQRSATLREQLMHAVTGAP